MNENDQYIQERDSYAKEYEGFSKDEIDKVVDELCERRVGLYALFDAHYDRRDELNKKIFEVDMRLAAIETL